MAKTGKGHGTDVVIKKMFSPLKCNVEFNYSDDNIPHPNTLVLMAFEADKQTDFARVISVGGGEIRFLDSKIPLNSYTYRLHTFDDIAEYCRNTGIRLWQYAIQNEKADFEEYMQDIWNAMKQSIRNGVNAEGILRVGLM